jgi:molybdate transport system substrate-binding protein
MKFDFFPIVIVSVLFSSVTVCAQITVAVAANVQFVMEELKAEFKKSTGIEVTASYGASGKFVTQIKNGAPFDLFISADMDFPDSLFQWGYAAEKARPYAYGKLVLWTLKDLDLDKGLALLQDSTLTQIALADPKRAPYGREAVKAMQRSGFYAQVEPKLVYGENISQVSQYILTGNVDIGFSAKSVVLANEVRGKGKWKEVDSTLYDKIAQGAVICKYGRENNPVLSTRFLDFLYSEPAKVLFSKYGYVLP